MRRDLVVQAVTAQKGDRELLAVVRALVVQDGDGRGGLAPGRRDVERGDLREARELSQASTADDGDTDGVWDIKSAHKALLSRCLSDPSSSPGRRARLRTGLPL